MGVKACPIFIMFKTQEQLKEYREKERVKQFKDAEYLRLNDRCGICRKQGITQAHGEVVEVLEVKVEDKIFKASLCDFHVYKLLLFSNRDMLDLIDRKQIEGEWIDRI